MQLDISMLTDLAQQLLDERKRQGLSREQVAAISNVSESFIRDAESDPGRCSLAKLLLLSQGLGLSVTMTGWQTTDGATLFNSSSQIPTP